VTLLKNCVVGADTHVEDGEEGDDLYCGIAAVVAGRLSVLRIHDIWCGSGSGSGSGSADPCLILMDPDPAIFVIDL
jgi:hypothetical protein